MKNVNKDFHEIVKALVENDRKKLSEISARERFDPTFLPIYDDKPNFNKQAKQKSSTSRNNRFIL